MNDQTQMQDERSTSGQSRSTVGLGVCSCGSTVDVITAAAWWTAWGSNSFDFKWQKHSGELSLCEKCENDEWVVCEECGARVDRELYGSGYPEDFDEAHICPECATNKGIAISVNITFPAQS